MEEVLKYKEWIVHGPAYHQQEILRHFVAQCWTLKPAFTKEEYGPDQVLGTHLNSMFANAT